MTAVIVAVKREQDDAILLSPKCRDFFELDKNHDVCHRVNSSCM